MAQYKVEVLVGLVDRLTRPLGALGKRMRTAGAWLGGGGIAASIGGKQILEPIRGAVQASIELESAMADVRKVVDFPTSNGLSKLQGQIEQLTKKIPLAASELAGIAAAGGQLGIAAPDLAAYTETVAKMATAFEMVPQAAGEAMAKLANVYKLPIKDIGSLGDAINHLSNNAAASAPDLVDALQRMGNAASFGLAAKDAAGLATALMALGETPERTGTALNFLFTQLQTAGKQGKKFQAALAQIGTSSDQLEASLAKNAKGGLMDFLSTLSQVDERSRTGILVDLFGKEHTAKIQKLVGNMEETKRVMDLVGDSSKFAGSMQAEFAARTDTTQNRLALLANRIAILKRGIGNALLPVIESLTERFGPLVDKAGAWIEKNKELVGTIATVVTAVGGALVVLGPLAVALGLLVGGMGMVSGGAAQLLSVVSLLGGGLGKLGKRVAPTPGLFARVTKSLRAMTFATWLSYRALGPAGLAKALATSAAAAVASPFKSLGRGLMTAVGAARALSVALLASPIGWIGLAIAGAAALIYKYWTPISGFFSGLWGGLKEGFAALAPVLAPVAKVFKPIGEAIGWVIDKVSAILGPVEDVGGAAEAMGRKFGLAIAAMIGKGAEFIAWLMSLPGKALEAGTRIVESIKSGFGGGWSGFLSFAQAKFQELLAAAKNIAAMFKAVGGLIVEGLKAGISAAWTGIKSWFSNKITGLVTAAKSALKIKSPSGVFADIGLNLIKGLHKGIARRAEGVVGQVRTLAKGLASVPLGLAPVAAPAMEMLPKLQTAVQSAASPSNPLEQIDRIVERMGPRNHPAVRQMPPVWKPPAEVQPGHAQRRGAEPNRAGQGGGPRISMPITINVQVAQGIDEHAIAEMIKQKMQEAGGHIVRRISSFYDDEDDV